VRQLCDTYPELAGIYAEASENIHVDLRAEFAKDTIVSGIHDSSQRPMLLFRGWISDPTAMKQAVLDEYDGECFFGVKYTFEHLVHRRPDPEFLRWVHTCGADRVLAEFWISNFQPFGCHDLELAAGIHEELRALGCAGFTSHPMDLYAAPFVQGTQQRVLQLDRDHAWYATLSGACESGLQLESTRFGLANLPVDTLRAASRPFVRASWYITGNKQNFLQPQLLAFVAQTERRQAELQHLDRWRHLGPLTAASFGRWPEQLDGLVPRYPGDTEGEFGLTDLLAGLDELEQGWEDVPDSAPGLGDIYDVWRGDLRAQHALALAWTERVRAVIAHVEGRRERALKALRLSLAHACLVPDLLRHDGPYRLLIGRHTFIIRWSELIAALEAELADYAAGRLQGHYYFGTAEFRA
jgi:hypothetical protein